MKKLISLILLFAVFMLPAQAAVSLSDSPSVNENKIAAGEFGAKYAYFSPYDDFIYYLRSSSEGASVVIFDASKNDYETVKTFTPDADYISIGVDAEKNIYLLRHDLDETAKSGIICLKNEGGSYIVTEYLFSAASGDMIPISLEFSPYSSMGAVRFWLNSEGNYVCFVTTISALWGSLLGHDELIYLVPGELTARVQSMEGFFDAYGYQTEAAGEFLKKVEQGEYLTASDASLSPNGNMLMLLVDYHGEKIVYIMDMYTYQLEILYLEDDFSGTVGWADDGSVIALKDDGTQVEVDFQGFSAGEWSTGNDTSWDEGNNDSDWNQVDEENLSDWS